MVDNAILNTRAPKGFGIVYGYYYKGDLVYVGSTKNTIGKRAGVNGKGYVYSKCASDFGLFIMLHGWENMEARILAMPAIPELLKKEDELIDANDLIANGYNKYHACLDEDEGDEYTMKVNGHKANVYHDDPLRGDTRIGLIHDQTMKLNLCDKAAFEGYYVAQQHGSKLKNNSLAYYDDDGRHVSVIKKIRELWFGDKAGKYNISQGPKAEDIYDFRREATYANPVGRIDLRRPTLAVLADLAVGRDPFPLKRKGKQIS